MDRPFRAAAHALWKCLEVEWKDDDIRLRIVALEDSGAPLSASMEVCDASPEALLVDSDGLPLPW